MRDAGLVTEEKSGAFTRYHLAAPKTGAAYEGNGADATSALVAVVTRARGRDGRPCAPSGPVPVTRSVARKVLEASSVLQQGEGSADTNLSNVSPDKWSEILEKMSPDDFKYKM